MDTVATCNVTSYADTLLLLALLLCDVMQDGDPQLEASNVRLKPFGGQLIKARRQKDFSVHVMNGPLHMLTFQEVDGKQAPLLSAEACATLGLVTRQYPKQVYVMSDHLQPLTMDRTVRASMRKSLK